VRLAELENVWITTLGLLPGSSARWTEAAAVEEALYFTTGEVGAAKLLLATGWTTEEAAGAESPSRWLAEIKALDEAEKTLVQWGNGRAMVKDG
jgi:hypothetical protein